MAVLTMKELLEAGVHFGHQTKRWNPKMQKYIFGERNGIYIIDLQKTLKKFREAYAYVRDLAAGGGTLLMVGTKKQAQETVLEEAGRCGMYYVNHRWLGGTLTNFSTIRKSIARLKKLDEMKETIAVEEARRLAIPIVAIVDTNCDPTGIDYPIPGNDDAIRSVRLITSRIADAVLEGAGTLAKEAATADEIPASPDLPLVTEAEMAAAAEAPAQA